jgi:5-methylcytosine-specific restriction enzyme subunit McrC
VIGTSQEKCDLTLREWEERHFDDVRLRSEDNALTESLSRGSDARLAIDELRTGLRLRSRSWVGVVQFSDFELRIVPKLPGDNIGLAKMIDFASGLDALDRHPSFHALDATGLNLFDLIALLLAEACETIVRGGLLADYHEIEEDLPVIRGRLLLKKQFLTRFERVDRLECRYDDHTTQSIENQILLATLRECATRVGNSGVSLRIRRLAGIFAEACALDDFDLRLARASLTYNRLNEHYREAHSLSWLILEGLGIDDIYGGTTHRTFAFLLDMNVLFERFVTRWLNWLVQGTRLRVYQQRQDRSILWDAVSCKPYARITPDILIERQGQEGVFLPIDAKYKLYNDRGIDPGDIYQTFLYAYAYGEHHAVLPTAIILYPSSISCPSRVLHVRRRNGKSHAEIVGLGLNIPEALEEARTEYHGTQGQQVLDQIRKSMQYAVGSEGP